MNGCPFHSSTSPRPSKNLPLAVQPKSQRLKPVSFGLEIELSLQFNPAMLQEFRPPIESDESWTALSPEDRLARGRYWNQISQHLFLGCASFERLNDAPDFLPPELIGEGVTLANEIKSQVFWDIKECSNFLYACESRYGPAQVQGHVVCERRAIPGFAGYAVFESDAALLKTLTCEYAAYLESNRPPAGHFIARFLPPLSEASKSNFVEMEENAGHADAPLREHAIKYASPVLRPGKLYSDENLMGIELRQWDTPSVGAAPMPGRAEELLISMFLLEQILLSKRGFAAFQPFAQTPLSGHGRLRSELSNESGWNALDRFLGIQAHLKGFIPPAQLPVSILSNDGSPMTQLVSFPFRCWEGHPVFSYVTPAKKGRVLGMLSAARKEFLEDLQKVIQDIQKLGVESSIEFRFADSERAEGVLTQLRINLARWAHESGLHELFDDAVYDQLLD